MFEHGLFFKTPTTLDLCASGAANPNLDDFIAGEITCAIWLDRSGELVNKVDEAALMARYNAAEALLEVQPKQTWQQDDP